MNLAEGQRAAGAASAAPVLDFDQVWRLHGRALGRWAARLSGTMVDAADVVQDVLLVVHRRLPEFQGDAEQLPGWLFRITENVVRQKRRREKFRRWLGGSAEEVAGEVPSGAPDAEGTLEARQGLRRAQQVLESLSEKHRTLIILFEVEQLSGQEIADLLSMKVTTVWVNLHRARQKFLAAQRALDAQEAARG
ncbi:MAG: RNA polymerase sigma factor [Myxococcaceae bacterium]|nr:RNA polymerase sigma factor [Myxococcaceae bacterium]